TAPIFEADGPKQKATPEIQLLTVREKRNGPRIEAIFAGDAQLDREPVGKIDEVFGLDDAARDVGTKAVVASSEIRPRIVDLVRDRPWPACTRGEIAVAQGTQRLAN